MEDKNILILAALIVICIIEIVALLKGINGAMLMMVFLMIGGLVGYSVPAAIGKFKS